ncbi:MAG TPA: glycosyltransferase, partial [Chitinophagaceae bacterium]|nr:glycosyltransferase [Chitinophagaceae bacterium]
KRADLICAIDLDTILPCLLISRIKSIPRVYDAHELFTEMKEVRSRPAVHKVWASIERFTVPRFRYGYTVSDGLRDEFYKRHGVSYSTIRNIPPLDTEPLPIDTNAFILYQGMVNEGRGFEYLVPAMKKVDHILLICGDGNFMSQLKALVKRHELEDKIIIKGLVLPSLLKDITRQAVIGINLVEREGLNQYYSLPNKFFDYIQAGVPQVTMDYPEYKILNDQYGVALLLEELNADAIADAINTLLDDEALRNKLRTNCILAKPELNWQQEEKKLIQFYDNIFKQDIG